MNNTEKSMTIAEATLLMNNSDLTDAIFLFSESDIITADTSDFLAGKAYTGINYRALNILGKEKVETINTSAQKVRDRVIVRIESLFPSKDRKYIDFMFKLMQFYSSYLSSYIFDSEEKTREFLERYGKTELPELPYRRLKVVSIGGLAEGNPKILH